MIGIYVKANDLASEYEQANFCEKGLKSDEKSKTTIYSDIGNCRIELKNLIENVKAGKIKKVICSELSRFSRRNNEIIELLDIFNENNVRLVINNEDIDYSIMKRIVLDINEIKTT
ncbi:recombinase family protein [Clostridium gasigenes]|uniref:recombinase family protein n=1 Tax=Clostridium gasigenes TaxID=94869 RepID=UPI001C0AFCDC|nr:recombinase family protein [Clostridium gasigenes]